LVEWYVKTVGAKKMLFGTDMPSMEGRGNFCRLAMAEIEESDKQDIFGLNMKGIIDRVLI
jgi:predicted TIM-barrel fold metal-dependent hydrolase